MGRRDVPRTGDQAAQLLADLAASIPARDPRNPDTWGPRPPNQPASPRDASWLDTLTRTHPYPRAEALKRLVDAQAMADAQVRPDLPSVLRAGSWNPHTHRALGRRGAGRSSLFPNPLLSARRARLSVLGDLAGIPATPEGSWALTVTILGARETAGDLQTWADSLPTRQAARARDEARAYGAHAAAAEDQLPASFGWLSDAPAITRADEAQPIVTAQPRGFMQLGIT